MAHVKRFFENSSSKVVLGRKDEMNVIAYVVPGDKLAVILGRTPEKGWVVKTSDGIMTYSTNEMEEIYNIDMIESDFERLGRPS
jgi:hypothetical protein